MNYDKKESDMKIAHKVSRIIITEMIGEDSLYDVSFEGSAEDYDPSDQTDYLSDIDAFEIAEDARHQTGAKIVWEGYKPPWA